MPRLQFVIHPDGRVEATVGGVPGPGCTTLAAEAERLLGPAQQRRHTAEYWQRRATTHDPQSERA